MLRGVAKITISLPDELHAAVRDAVADGQAATVSALIADAVAERFRNGAINAVLAELDAADGPPSAADHLWAERVWRLADGGA